MHIPQKGQEKLQKKVKNGNKCQKITNNCKISEITKYGEKMTTIYKQCQCQKMPKNGPKMATKLPNFKTNAVIVFLARNYLKNGTSHFHTMFGS